MSRTIKFRAWDKEEKEYYYNAEHTYDFFCSGRGCYAESFGEVLNQPDRFIVEQCTGSKDKNGKEIYEGDILDTPGGRCLCVWGDDGWVYRFKTHRTDWFDIVKEFHEKSEVIGNIHENKELWSESV